MIENGSSRVRRHIDVPEAPQSEDPEASNRELFESLGLDWNTSANRRRLFPTASSSKESQTDLRFAVQEGIDGAAKARNPEHALGQILAGLADFIAPGAVDRFDSKGLLDHLRTVFGGEGGASNGTQSLPDEQKQPDSQTYDQVASDLVESFHAFAGENPNIITLSESLKAAFNGANQAGLDSATLLSSLGNALKKGA